MPNSAIYEFYKKDVKKIMDVWGPHFGEEAAAGKNKFNSLLKRDLVPQRFMSALSEVCTYLEGQRVSPPNTGADLTDAEKAKNKKIDEAKAALNAIVTDLTQRMGSSEQERTARFLLRNTADSSVQGKKTLDDTELPHNGDLVYKYNEKGLLGQDISRNVLVSFSTSNNELTISALGRNNSNVSWGIKNDALVKGAVAAYGIGGDVEIVGFDAEKFLKGKDSVRADHKLFAEKKWYEAPQNVEYYRQYQDLMMKLSEAGLKVDAKQLQCLHPRDQDKAKKMYDAKVKQDKADNKARKASPPGLTVETQDNDSNKSVPYARN